MKNKVDSAFESLQKSLNVMTKDGNSITPMIIVSRGTDFIIQTVTQNGRSLSRMCDPNLPLIFGEGRWLLLEGDVWILINELAEAVKNEIKFMDRKKDGWVQVYIPINNRMLNLKVFSITNSIKLWWKSLFDSRLKQLRNRFVSLP